MRKKPKNAKRAMRERTPIKRDLPDVHIAPLVEAKVTSRVRSAMPAIQANTQKFQVPVLACCARLVFANPRVTLSLAFHACRVIDPPPKARLIVMRVRKGVSHPTLVPTRRVRHAQVDFILQRLASAWRCVLPVLLDFIKEVK